MSRAEQVEACWDALAAERDAVTPRRVISPADLAALAAEIREEIEVLDQYGQPYDDLTAACGLIDQAAGYTPEARAATLYAAADAMSGAIDSLRTMAKGDAHNATTDLRTIHTDLTTRTLTPAQVHDKAQLIMMVAWDDPDTTPLLRTAAGLLASSSLLPETGENAPMRQRILEDAVSLIARVLGGAA